MKKIALLFLLVPVFGFSQKLNCEDFKTGSFMMTNDSYPGIEVAIYRNETTQTEQKATDDENRLEGLDEKLYETVEWLSECKYKLMFDGSKMELTEITKLINDNGGVLAEIISIKDNCCRYKSTFIINGKEEIMYGTICKDLSN